MKNRATLTCASIAFAAMALGAAQPALAKAKPEISYYLTRTNVSVAVTMTLLSCPAKVGEQPKIGTKWTVTALGEPDPMQPVRVDVSSGFLAKRSNAFEFYPNGTLAGFNGSSEGQGGAFISSVLKAVGAVAPLLGLAGMPKDNGPSTGPDPKAVIPPLYCSGASLAKLDDLSSIKAEIRALENKVLLGTATSADLDLLDRHRAKLAASVKGLTIQGVVEFPKDAAGKVIDGRDNWTGKVAFPELLADWFTAAPEVPAAIAFDQTKVAALHGFTVEIKPAYPDPKPDFSPAAVIDQSKPQRSLLYRVPVLAMVLVGDGNCQDSKCKEPLDLDAPLPIGQWGKVRELPVGSAGIFGSRQASANFDEFGTPMKLSYGSDSGAASIGSTIEAAGGTANAIADSETTSLERQVKKQELRNKLRDLQAAE